MPSLWKLTRNPIAWLIIIGVTFALTLLDSTRRPAEQVTVKIYVSGIRVYQATGRPILSKFVRCRHRPSCSQYCIQAAQKHGIRKGLLLCLKRIMSCTKKVPPGTFDPVPD
jgi:putative membrane protein insertion efficiency factor